jgi:hypothetical protein
MEVFTVLTVTFTLSSVIAIEHVVWMLECVIFRSSGVSILKLSCRQTRNIQKDWPEYCERYTSWFLHVQ